MSSHLLMLPIVLPLLVAAVLLLGPRKLAWQRGLGIASTLALLLLAGVIAARADDGSLSVYLVGNWPAKLGIALLADRLSAIMLLATASLGLATLLFASAGWDRRAPHFHALFQLQLMGLNGAFLTGDLFNLFVFFEVLLIASYGLMLSGGRGVRMRAGFHYVAFNITASTLFLVALGLLYGLTGALNMAEMATRIAAIPADQAGPIRAAGGLLLVVFCAKAALLPMYFWLPETYGRSPAAVAALFALMTKLGVYAVLRVYTLVFGSEAGAASDLAWPWLLPAGTLTLILAAIGAFAANSLRDLAGYLVVGSAATLFIAFSLGNAEAIGAGLYYLLHSTWIAAALFLLGDQIHRQRDNAGDSLRKLDHIAHRGLLGLLFLLVALSIAGLPPLSGFIGKVGVLAAVPEPLIPWLWPPILVSSLLVLMALAQAGSQLFWREGGEPAAPGKLPPLRRLELGAIALLLLFGIGLTLIAGPALRYTEAAGAQLLQPGSYRQAVDAALPVTREVNP
ncbi:MAG TPA: monovalent cation/H+ antiporter subunit D [Arenimonas sp.]|nr:monovalent cation/H+ antiporter subunit D [Arenimonas sp.]